MSLRSPLVPVVGLARLAGCVGVAPSGVADVAAPHALGFDTRGVMS
jgi:hypothetical protein